MGHAIATVQHPGRAVRAHPGQSRPVAPHPLRDPLRAKWDGFRTALIVGEGAPVIYSRNGTDLSTRFPELLAAAADLVPDGCVLDGEAVIWGHGRLDFDAGQRRLALASPVGDSHLLAVTEEFADTDA